MIAYSGMRQRSAATLFYDFLRAFLALAWRWMMAALRRLGVSPCLCRVITTLVAIDCFSLRVRRWARWE